jgi:hypothetical protein
MTASIKPPGSPNRITWCAPHPLPVQNDEQQADNLRSLALDIEGALAKDHRGVSMTPPVARLVSRALFDLADRVELG